MATPQVAPTYPALPAYQAPQAAATQSGGAFAPYHAVIPAMTNGIAAQVMSRLATAGQGLTGGWDSGVPNMAAANPMIEAQDRKAETAQDNEARIAGINASQQSSAQRSAEMSAANHNQFNQGVYRGQADLAGRVYGAQIQNALGQERLSQGLKLGLGSQANQLSIAKLNAQTRQHGDLLRAIGTGLQPLVETDSLSTKSSPWANLGPATTNVANALQGAMGMPKVPTIQAAG